jgi:hypothetical protein
MDGKKGYSMPINVRGTKSRDELIAELKEVRAAFVRVQGDGASPEFELRWMTEQLKRLCAQRAKSIEAERASWLPWSSGGGSRGAARVDREAVDNRGENDDRRSNGQGIDARGAQ